MSYSKPNLDSKHYENLFNSLPSKTFPINSSDSDIYLNPSFFS